jgi:hypothetical protein
MPVEKSAELKNKKIVSDFDQSMNIKKICSKILSKDHIWEKNIF